MAKAGFHRNAKTIGHILKNDAGLHAAVKAAAEDVLAKVNDPEAFLEEYETDRDVVAVMVPADKQARHGLATKAAGAAGLTPR